jgi:sialate O-acetylesterase
MTFNLDDFQQFPISPSNNDEAAVLYNAMINPLIKYTIRGAIWYQGENNAERPILYRKLFPMLINSWRAKWNQIDIPFYFVQLANFMKKETIPRPSNWAALREAQSMALSLPNTGMAVAIDIGNAKDIHPKNKQEVGRRLALNALALTYNKNLVYSGPVYDSMQISGDTIKLAFSHTGSGMIIKDEEKLKGFSIADANKKFVWANAIIVDNEILVWSNKIKNPQSVRYGWANNPNCNLYNKEGLPASPFRTDDWDLIIDSDNYY